MGNITTINNKTISYFELGKGDVIILLHGYLETKEVWNTFASELAKKYRVIAIDIPGHGKSTMLNENQTMDLIAIQIKDLLNKLDIVNCTMVGHSMGGYVMLAFAQQFPEMINKFVLFHSSVYADTEEKKANRQREIEFIQNGKLELIVNTNLPNTFAKENEAKFETELEQMKVMAKLHSNIGVCALLKAMMNRPDRQELIKNFSEPMLFIFGKKDNYIPTVAGEKMCALNENIKVLWLENSGHMGFVEEQDVAIKAIEGFV